MSVKNVLALAVVSATATLVGCGSSSSSAPAPKDTTLPVYEARTTAVDCGVATDTELNILMGDNTYTPLCELSGVISENATLSADNVYRLSGYVTVGTGNLELGLEDQAAKDAVEAAGVTLTIPAGTHFRSSGDGSLVISRGSEIAANGTAAAPIVMSSVDAGYTGQGEWGGLVLQGFAKNNECGDGLTGSTAVACDTADEALTGFHGGNDDADSSGSISHLIIAEGGFEIAPDSEVNGITLHSVGYGTSLSNIMVYGNADDGIEFFGGSANVSNLILIDNGDESLDWDNGWRGNVQFALVRQGVANEGDHGIEADTAGPANDALPESNPVIANVTFQEVATAGADDLFRFKKGTEGTLQNIAADGYNECIRAEGSDVDVTLTNVLIECTAYDTSSDNFNFEYVSGGKSTEGEDAVSAADVLTADTTANASLTGIDSDTVGASIVALGNAFEVTGGNGSVAANTPASANASTGFFVETNYVGAVNPTVTDASTAWYAWAADVIPAAFQ